ncbi:MAG: hypothetical protein WC942_10315 [Clostridia bacterium]|jgi:hypothetical protein
MLVASGLYDKITEKMENVIASEKNYPSSASDAFSRFSQAIGEYIEENATITYGWSGVFTPPPPAAPIPDTVITFNASISYGGSVMAVPNSYATFILNLSTFLRTAFTLSAPSDFTLSPLTFNPAGLVTIVMANETSYQTAMTKICNNIITQFKTNYINPTPATGTHLPTGPTPFLGSTVSMLIG